MSDSRDVNAHPPPDMGRVLRGKMLTTSPDEVGIAPTAEFPRIYGVLMDWPVGGGDIATVAMLSDGNASLYTTSSFGIVGGFVHEAVRQNAIEAVRIADRHFSAAIPAAALDYPPSDLVRFYFLTFAGVRVLDAKANAMVDDNEYTDLFYQAQRVLTALRMIEQREIGGGAAEDDPEWLGVPGYVNCLLTSMSEGLARVIELDAGCSVPNLSELASGAGLKQWIEEQRFAYEDLDTKEVIALLRSSASVGGLAFLRNKGELATIDIRKDGRRVARVFDLTIGPFNRTARIELAGDDDPRVIVLQKNADELDAGESS